MGYLVSATLIRKRDDYSPLNEMPGTLPWRIYQSEVMSDHLVDVINFRKAPEYPFTSMPAIQDLPLHFDAPLGELNTLYDELKKKNRSNGFKRAIVSLNLMLSKLSASEALSFLSNDEGVDFSCISENGALKKLRFRAGKIEVIWTKEGGLNTENKSSSRLHYIAESESKIFVGKSLPIFGFDGDSTQLDLIEVASSGPIPPTKPKPPRGGWAARDRMQREFRAQSKKWWQFWK